jgi:hypothetical protein
MISRSLITTVRESYETLGMTLEEIAETEGMDVESIQGILMSASGLYRARTKKGIEEGISRDGELMAAAKEAIVDCMRNAGEEEKHIKLKAAIWLYEEELGRNDERIKNKKVISTPPISIKLILNQLEQTRRLAQENQQRSLLGNNKSKESCASNTRAATSEIEDVILEGKTIDV